MSAPALPCPPWCDRRHAPHDAVHSHTCCRKVGRDVVVALMQADYGDDTPELNSSNGQLCIDLRRLSDLKGAQVLLGEADELAGLATLLGRQDVATAIAELAALGRAEPAGGTS